VTAAGFVVETKEMEPLLLVEDKTELRTMLRKALERAGYAVDEAPDGAAAIQKVRARRYLNGDHGFEDAGGFGAGRPARDQAGGCSDTGAAADGVWIRGRSRSRDEGRRVWIFCKSRWTWSI